MGYCYFLHLILLYVSAKADFKSVKLTECTTSLQRSLDCKSGHYHLSKSQKNYISSHAKPVALLCGIMSWGGWGGG